MWFLEQKTAPLKVQMNCPNCKNPELKVVDSREVEDGIRRRRECLGCGFRFTTYERIQPAALFVLKRDGRREEWSKEKLLGGLHKACEKRPLPAGTVDRIADEIEAELIETGRAEIPTTLVGDKVMEKLKAADNIAYIRFASVYRKFTDVTEFKEMVDRLIDRDPAPRSQLPLLPEEDGAGQGRGGRHLSLSAKGQGK
ncbi:transcriptional regulator NrdR [Dehalogenimonas alkenigignens]|uniref:transcriptional regulator NrdR n=1 Tax=Dehalogenimonas alkenigignens TaxID=1217799 RepID=UPI003CCD8BCE